MFFFPEWKPLAIIQIIIACGINRLNKEVNIINAQVGHSPGYFFIVPGNDEGLSREDHSGDIEFSGDNLMHLHPYAWDVESHVHVIGKNRFARLAPFAGDSPVITSREGDNAQLFQFIQ